MNREEAIDMIAEHNIAWNDDISDRLISGLSEVIDAIARYNIAMDKYRPDVKEAREQLSVIKEHKNRIRGRLAILDGDMAIWARSMGIDYKTKSDNRLIKIAAKIQESENERIR